MRKITHHAGEFDAANRATTACWFSAQFCALFQPDASGIDGGVGDGFVADPRSGAVIWAPPATAHPKPEFARAPAERALARLGASGAGLPWRRPSRLRRSGCEQQNRFGWRQ